MSKKKNKKLLKEAARIVEKAYQEDEIEFFKDVVNRRNLAAWEAGLGAYDCGDYERGNAHMMNQAVWELNRIATALEVIAGIGGSNHDSH